MIVKLPPNIPYRFQSQNIQPETIRQINNSVAFCSTAKLIKLVPPSKTREPLKAVTLWWLRKAGNVANTAASEIDTFVKRQVADMVIPEILSRWGKSGIKPGFDMSFVPVTELTNADLILPKGTLVMSLKTGISHPLPGQYRVTEGKTVYDIHIPQTKEGGKSGCIVRSSKSKKGVAQSVCFNNDVQRIIRALLGNTKTST